MERGSDDVLVAITKPERGREMIGTVIPIDIFDSIRLVSTKRTSSDADLSSAEQIKQSTDNFETYYEGYVDGKKYLVPDSNLEAMKDMINLRMRQRKSTRFQHQTSTDVEDEMTLERIEKILAKIRDINLSTSSNRSSIKSEPNKVREERATQQWSQRTSLTKEENESNLNSLRPSRAMLQVEKESRTETQNSSLPKENSFSLPKPSLLSEGKSESNKHNIRELLSESEEEEESVDCYLRLVLSGHFKTNEKPIYIIQEYNTKPNLFCKQSADFTSSQTQGNVHIFIAGKLFKENILEETDGRPTCLNLKPNKIIIDVSKCKIFCSYFENTYSKKETDITIKGEFLQNEKSMDITPFLSVIIKKNSTNMALSNIDNNRKDSEEKRPSILVKNRDSIRSSSSEILKDKKRVSFKESLDEEELCVIYKNIKKKKPDDTLPTQAIYPKKEDHHHQNRLNENKKSRGHKQIVPKRKVMERIFYLITENIWFKKLFAKNK